MSNDPPPPKGPPLEELGAQRSGPAAADRDPTLPDGLLPFLSALTHQLRNAVFGLTATIDLLEIALPRTPPFDQAATTMRQHTARLLRILAELDAYGTASLPPSETAALTPQVREAAAAVAGLAEERAVTLTVACAEAPHAVQLEPANLTRALRSLLEIAILRSPARGSVTLKTQVGDDGLVEVRVEDGGPALGPEVLPRALEPFALRGGEFSGLSLTLAARIARAHGGQLLLEQPPKGGLVARLLLPLAAPEGS